MRITLLPFPETTILIPTGSQNAYLVSRKTGGGAYFSRDPANLLNKHSRTHAGFINSKAVSVQPSGDKGVTLHTKKDGKSNTPHKSLNSHKFKGGRSNQKYVHSRIWGVSVNFGSTRANEIEHRVYKAVADSVGKNGYRGDLNQTAVARASAILESQRPKKDVPERKPRGSKAKKEAA